MPTEQQITVYLCNVCGRKHNNYGDAMECEQKPLLDQQKLLRQFAIGAEINFQSEWPMGSRWCYESAGGKIIEKSIVTTESHHQYMYIVANEHRGCREGVVWVEDGGFGWKLMSFAEMKFR